MSAIAGIFYRDNRPVDPAQLSRMMETLAYRGPDAAHSWRNGPLGMGHLMLYTTPESLHEPLPFVNAAGKVVITADARLDNRSELASVLGIDARTLTQMPDSQLIVAAYQEWGEACTEKLLGAFAFALWDEDRKQLFCGRDHLGLKSFYYYLSGQAFIFASDIKAILCNAEVPRRLNEARVADHLAPLLEDNIHTFYADILRLPPAHQLSVGSDQFSIRAYWSLDPHREISMSSDGDYAEAFREIFTGVIDSSLRSAFPVGSQLSGGLDSSSITCVARNLLHTEKYTGKYTGKYTEQHRKLQTFSFTFDEDAACYELPYINHVLAQNGVAPHFARGDQSGPLTNVESFLDYADEPFHLPNFFQSWDLFTLIQSQGIRVVLDGFDGDSTVSHGWTYLTELADASRWQELGEEAEASGSRHQRISSLGLLKRHGYPTLHKRARDGQWLRLIGDTHEIAKHFPVSQWDLFYRHGVRPALSASLRRIRNRQIVAANELRDVSPLLDQSFIARIDLAGRIQELAGGRLQPAQTERENHWYALTTGLFSHVLEKMESLAAPFQLDVRHPFMDKRLVEFCLALPPEQKRSQGWDRLIMRRAMTDILPDEVQWRPGKADFSNNFIDGLFRYDRALLDRVILKEELCVSQYVNVDKLRDFYRQLAETRIDRGGMATTLWLIVLLEVWLRRTSLTP